MGTLQELQAIGDSEFETLVAHYLRRRDRRLVGLIVTGINEEGKPIPCPVDGILYVPGDPPQCITVATTTMARNKLRGKWLGTKDEAGDVWKAVDEFKEWRAIEPEVDCTLYLATNRLLKSDVNLYRDVMREGCANNIEIVIVEASQIVYFLDQDPEGQYLREEFFSIDAERLSGSLLRRIAYSSLSHHRHTFAVGGGRHRSEISRDVHSQILSTLEESPASLVGLVGVSGSGKSTLIRQIGEEINRRGDIALWVPAEDIVLGVSITNLLFTVLRRFHPSLNSRAGEDAVDLAKTVPGGLALLVDDVNRLSAPDQALHGLRMWTAMTSYGESPSLFNGRPWFRFVVPLWPGQLSVSPESPSEKYTDWKFIELGAYSSREREELASLLSEGYPEEAREVIEALDGDPFLCGLASTDVSVPVGTSRSSLIQRIFDNALTRACTEALQTRRILATSGEFSAAVDGLLGLMVRDSQPELRWSDIRCALGDRNADLLQVLGHTNQLGWLESQGAQETWRWKHERLRDAFLGRWLAQNALPRAIRGEANDEILEWLSNPGLAEAWALALVFLSDDARVRAVNIFAECQPLALAEALRLNLFPSEGVLRQCIAEGLTQVLTGFDERTHEFVRSPQRWVIEKLSQTRDSLVLKVTEGLSPAWGIWAARLRNGDLQAGLEWIGQVLEWGDFPPGIRDSLLEQAIVSFKSLYTQRRDRLEEKLTQAAEQPEATAAALTLAGYLAWSELSHPLWDAWNLLSHEEKLDTLAPIVWALSRCGDCSAQLEETLLFVHELSDDGRDEGQGSDRLWHFMEPLWQTLCRWPITSASAETWAKVTSEHPDLSETMCYVLRGIDHPAAMETFIRWGAERGGILWDYSFEPIDPLSQYPHDPRNPVNPSTRDHLWKIFMNDPDEAVRRVAFSFWKRSVKVSDLARLREVPPSDSLFERVLQVRIRLRDETATGLLLERMEADPGRWCGFAPKLYDQPGVAEALLDNLEAGLSSSIWRPYAVAQHLPSEGVRKLVKEKRDLLLGSPRTWQALWRSDVPEALAFVQEAIAGAEPVDLQFFFYESEFPFPVSRRMLDGLVPVLECLPVRGQKRLIDLAIRGGLADWVQDHLLDAAVGSHYWLTIEDVMDILTAATNAVPEGPRKVRDTPDFSRLLFVLGDNYVGSATDIVEILQIWLGSSPEGNQLIVAAMLLVAFGTSDHIDWWQSMKPDEESAYEAWSRALYTLKRRQWHS